MLLSVLNFPQKSRKIHELKRDPNAHLNLSKNEGESIVDVQKLNLIGKVDALTHELSTARTENQLLVDTIADSYSAIPASQSRKVIRGTGFGVLNQPSLFPFIWSRAALY